MVTVAEAAAALGIDERTVREKLSKDEWKGEKRLIGMKEKWFMYRGELDRQIERLRILRPQERISSKGMEDVFESVDTVETHTVDAQSVEIANESRVGTKVDIALDEVLSTIAEQFSKQLNAEKEIVFSLKRELDEKDRQLRLLPDLQKRAEEDRQAAQINELEAIALRKQIAALQSEQEEVRQAKERVHELERQLSESHTQSQDEISRIKEEKDAQTKMVEEQLKQLSATIEQLKQPWWKKMFATPPADGKAT
jgi:DNA repair exonuclease SbcCD ATPase subunit